jgi:hypothetical protein
MGVLINKQYKDYQYFSRYQNIPYYFHTEDRKYISGTTTHINSNTPYVLHEVKINDTLDTLALHYYNNPTYFWIIADFNKIQNPYLKLDLGLKLKIPIFNEITFEEKI